MKVLENRARKYKIESIMKKRNKKRKNELK